MAQVRDMSMLTPPVRHKWAQVEAELKSAGIKVVVIETWRPESIQKAYYAQGRESLPVVNMLRRNVGLWAITEEQNRKITWSRESTHFYGVALDFALVINGKPSWNTKADINEDSIPDYENVGRIAKKYGFDWGGDWENKDYAHVQYLSGLTLADLRAGKRPVENVLKCTEEETK